MGAGDTKLMGAVGAILGAKSVFVAFLLTALVGGIYAVIIILLNKKQYKGFFKKQLVTLQLFILTRKFIPDPVEESTKNPKLCYGVAISVGTLVYIYLERAGNLQTFLTARPVACVSNCFCGK